MSLNDMVVEMISERGDISIGPDGVLEVDELQEVELVIALEEEFGIKIPDADHCRLRTVEGIVEYVYSMKPGNSAIPEKR